MDDLDRLLTKKLKEPEFEKEWDKLEFKIYSYQRVYLNMEYLIFYKLI